MSAHERKTDQAGRQNTLGLSLTKLESILDKLEKESDGESIRRDDARWPFRQPSIGVTLIHPGGSQVDVHMACRNLSRGGAGLLHSTFLYNGTRCIFSLPHHERGMVPVEGEVVRCQHREGMIHEIGVRFDAPIDLRAFTNPNPLSQLFSAERVDASTLEGTLLYVDPSEEDRDVLTSCLKDTGVYVVPATTAKEGLDLAKKGVDMIIAEFALDDMSGAEFVVQLRSENISKPVLFLTHDMSDRVTNAVNRRMAQAMIRKPIVEETLFAALAEFLHPSVGTDAPGSRVVDPQLVEALKPEFARCARQIDTAVRNNKPMEAISSCHVLQQIASLVGLSRMSENIAVVLVGLSETMEIEPVADDLRFIIEECRRAA